MKTITHTFELPYHKSLSIEELTKIVEEKSSKVVPEEYKSSVKLEFVYTPCECDETRDFYGFYLTYERPYTEEELKKIEEQKEINKKWAYERQVENLGTLIKKYPAEAKDFLDKLE